MNTLLDFYYKTRQRFPDITKKADAIHIKYWGDLDPEYAYSWFESLAKTINIDMANGVNYEIHKELFEFMEESAQNGVNEIFNCIDVAFIENLFWQVPKQGIDEYWPPLPHLLKELYGNFHGHAP